MRTKFFRMAIISGVCGLHALMHTPQDVVQHSSCAVLKKKLGPRHVDDRIHMHFHDNPTNTQHNNAHIYEVSLGNTTPLEELFRHCAEYVWLSGRITLLHKKKETTWAWTNMVDISRGGDVEH